MKPNFALSLFFDKVELLHRSDDDWVVVDDVAFDAEDLAGALSKLRKAALTRDPAGLRTKLILPDEQVKFLSLPEADADDAAVRAALEEATPYSLDELVYEASSDGRRTHIAAVAKETLAEAEAFAVEHRFAPVSIVAQKVVGRFDGEPYFGMTKAAAGLLGPDESVERDDAPAAIAQAEKAKVETPPAPAKPVEDVAKAKVEAPKVDAPKAEAPKTEAPAKEAPKAKAGETPSRIVRPEGEAATETAPEIRLAEAAKSEAKNPSKPVADEPVFASRERSVPPTDPDDPISSAVTAMRNDTPRRITPQIDEPAGDTPAAPVGKPKSAPEVEAKPAEVSAQPRTVPQTVPARPAPGTPPPAVAERLARLARSNVTADRTDDLPPRNVAPVPPRPVTASKAAPAVSATPSVAASPKEIAATLTPDADTPPAKAGAGLFARRKDAEADVADAAASGAATASPKDRSKMTVFDQQTDAPVRGKPKYLLLILVALLLLFMAAAAAWASLFTEEGIAGWFGGGADSEIAVTETEAETIIAAAPIEPEQVEVLDAPVVDGGDAIVLPGVADPVTIEQATPEQLAGVALPQDGVLDPEVIANPAAAPQEVATAEPLVVSPDTPIGTVLSPAEAERFYAATGVWLRAPRLPLLPTGEGLGVLSTAETDRALNTRTLTASLPVEGLLEPDLGLGTQLDPPAADVVFARDARGLLLATPDGTLTPYGMVIYAGQPAVVPPTRPGTVAPIVVAEPVEEPATAPVEEPAEETPEVAETDADAVAAALEALIAETVEGQAEVPEVAPQLAPQLAPVDAETGLVVATADGALTSEGILIFAGLPAVVPPTRPGTEVPLAAPDVTEPEVVETEDGVADTPTAGAVSLAGLRPNLRPTTLDVPVVLAAYDGIRPALRPQDLAPVDEVEAEAEVAPEEPAIDDTTIASTLASIIADGPDPLASATSAAVASAILPEGRPNNFDRVVSAAQERAAAAAATQAAPVVVSGAAAEPSGPIPQSVASAATIESAINLREINLIGVFGRANDRRALVRLANGRFVRVSVGDTLDGGRVTAIGENVINYVRRGTTIALGVPGRG